MDKIGNEIAKTKAKIEQLRAAMKDRPTVSKLPKPDYRICPTCKFELQSEQEHGWVKAGVDAYTGQSIVRACPTCSKNAKARLSSVSQADLVSRLFGGSHIPHQMRHFSFDTYPEQGDQVALEKVKKWLDLTSEGDDSTRPGLYLVGQVGRGKTGLAVCILKAVIESGQTGLFVQGIELMHRIRATFGKEGSDELLDVITRVPWLVLDDLAVERPTEFVIEQLYYIIETRRTRGLHTIITSNLSTKELEKFWRPKGLEDGQFHPGMRVIERIREGCQGIHVQGENLRATDW